MLPGLVFGFSQGPVVREDAGGGPPLLGKVKEVGDRDSAACQPFYVQTRPSAPLPGTPPGTPSSSERGER